MRLPAGRNNTPIMAGFLLVKVRIQGRSLTHFLYCLPYATITQRCKKMYNVYWIIVLDLLLFIFAGCGCIFFMYFVCKKKWISNLLACLLLPIKTEGMGEACKMKKENK